MPYVVAVLAVLVSLILVVPAVAVEVRVVPKVPRQGDTVLVFVAGTKGAQNVEGSLGAQHLAFFPYGAEFAALAQFPIIPCDLCGSQSNLKRVRMKRLLEELEKEIPHIRGSLLTALGNAVPSHLMDHELFDFKKMAPGAGDIAAELDFAVGHTDEGLGPTLVSIM